MMRDKTIKLSNKKIGNKEPCFIIAEAGMSHFGSIDKAIALVDMAVDAEADAIKFQMFDTEELFAKKELFWKNRFKNRVLTLEELEYVKKYCQKKGIIFFSTAHDEKSLELLNKLKPELYKIGSGEVRNWDFIKKVAILKKPTIVSIGMYEYKDIIKLKNIFIQANNTKLIILHCVTSYPANPSIINLNFIKKLKNNFDYIIGYSDHTEGFHIPLASLSLGVKVIEKHITLKYNIKNAQDWRVSCGPDNLKAFISQAREIEKALGVEKKIISKDEEKSLSWARKSIVASQNISRGQLLKLSDIKFKRPGTGLAPDQKNNILGKIAKKNIEKGQILKISDFKK